MEHLQIRDIIENHMSGRMLRKQGGFPQQGNPARIQASLSSP